MHYFCTFGPDQFVFVQVYFANDVPNNRFFVAGVNDLGRGQAFLYVKSQYFVEYRVGRQAVFILLVFAQFRRWGLVDHPGRDHLARRANH